MAVYGYCRISTAKQDVERQVGEIIIYCKSHNLGEPTIEREVASGLEANKPILNAVLSSLKPGDSLLVWELSRLTRNGIAALFDITEQIKKAGATLIETRSGIIFDSTSSGEAYIYQSAVASRMEGELISARTRSALAARKASGVKLGRKAGVSKLDSRRTEIEDYRKKRVDKANLARILGVSRGCLLNWMRLNGVT